MQCLVINNDGGGFADYIELTEGTTVSKLVEEQIGAAKAANYLIRVNRQPCAADQVLKEGDRVSITPTKIEGAIWLRPPGAGSAASKLLSERMTIRWCVISGRCCGWLR